MSGSAERPVATGKLLVASRVMVRSSIQADV
jgi:hypothetical protein